MLWVELNKLEVGPFLFFPGILLRSPFVCAGASVVWPDPFLHTAKLVWDPVSALVCIG